MQQKHPDDIHQRADNVGEAVKLFSAFRPKIEWRKLEELRPNPNNARTHNRKQSRAIAASIKQLGFNNPILIDMNNVIVAGHGRFEAAKGIGLTEVPVIQLNHLNPDEVRAFMLADNQLATLAGWDDEILAIELQHLVEVNFELDVTGFEAPKIDMLIEGQLTGPGSNQADAIPEMNPGEPTVSRLGDVWCLGDHRLMCGDSLSAMHMRYLMRDVRARLLFSDPPFNVRIANNVCGLGTIKHREFVMASGEMTRDEFRAFLLSAISNAARYTMDGAIHFWCMDWRSIDLLLSAGRDVLSEVLNVCVWNKTNAGMGSLYRSQHEMIAVFKHGTAAHLNNIELGKHGRNRSNIWTYPGISSLKPDRMEQLAMHPTVKPVALVSDAIRDASVRGNVVLDPFMGSGTTIIAGEETGRKAYGLELDPLYVDVAVRRWQVFTGGMAYHAETGLSFNEVQDLRNGQVLLLPSPSQPDEREK